MADEGYRSAPSFTRQGVNFDDEEEDFVHPATRAAMLKMQMRELADAAAACQARAGELEQAGEVEQAMLEYRQAAEQMLHAAEAAPQGSASDKAAFGRRARQLNVRLAYLGGLDGEPAAAPISVHIYDCDSPRAADSEQDGSLDSEGCSNFSRESEGDEREDGEEAGEKKKKKKPSLAQRAASAAAMTGAATVVVLHAPIMAVAVAGGAAYSTTREDGLGKAARTVGDVGIKLNAGAKSLDERYSISSKTSDALSGVRSVDEKYGISSAARSATVSSLESLNDFNKKHKVTRKLGKGVVSVAGSTASAASSFTKWATKSWS